jgi:DNA-binding protein YbaB
MDSILKNFKEFAKLFSSESIVVEKNGIKVKINGKFEIEEIILNPDLDLVKQQKN